MLAVVRNLLLELFKGFRKLGRLRSKLTALLSAVALTLGLTVALPVPPASADPATLNYAVNCSASGPVLGDGTAIYFSVNQGDTINFTNAGGSCAGWQNDSLYPAFEAISPGGATFPEANITEFNPYNGNLSVKVKDNAAINGGNGVNRTYRFYIGSGAISRGQVFFMTINAVPRITSITPSEGGTVGGTSITITGSGFEQTSTVSVGGSPCTGVNTGTALTNWRTSTSITCNTPSGSLGAVDVSVSISTTNTLTATSTLGYTYISSFVIGTIVPNSGTTAGGTPITITGLAFAAGATVTVGGQPCTGVSVTPTTSITCTTPAGTAGAANVVVTNLDETSTTSTGGFTYISAPSITSISPSVGDSTGATSITITGTEFAAGVTVTVGGQPCTPVVVVSSTSITCTTPAGTVGTADVVVTNTDTGTVTSAGAFTYDPVPDETSITSCSFDGVQNYSATIKKGGSKTITLNKTGGDTALQSAYEPEEGVLYEELLPFYLEGVEVTIPWTAEFAGKTAYVYFKSFWYDEGTTTAIEPSLCSLTFTFGPDTQVQATPKKLPQTSTITSCSAPSGSGDGGNSVVISGAFATPVQSIDVGGVTLAASAWVQTATSVTITMPPGAAGSVPIQMENGRSPSLSPCNYTYLTSAKKQPLAKALKLKVFFGLGSNKITAAESAKLKAFAKKLAGLGAKITLTVTGYAQPTPGSEKTDGALSKRRASAVAAYLKKAGVTTKVVYAGAGRASVNTASSRYVEIVADNK